MIEYDMCVNITNFAFDVVRFLILDVSLILSVIYNINANEHGAYIEKVRISILAIQIIVNMKIRRTKTINSYAKIKCKYVFQIFPLVLVSIILLIGIIISFYQLYSELTMTNIVVDITSIKNDKSTIIQNVVPRLEIWLYIIKYYILGFILEILMHLVRFAFM